MRFLKNSVAAFLLAAAMLIPLTALADVTLTSEGTGIISSPNIQKALDEAKQDAYSKALTQYALTLAAQSMQYAVMKTFPELIRERGMKDATIIRLVSKNIQVNAVHATYEFRTDDGFIKEWLKINRYDVPQELRPRVLLAITVSTPGEAAGQWWQNATQKKYSVFESQLAAELALWGENVFTHAPDSRAVGIDALTVASLFKADLLISGTVKVQRGANSVNSCTLKLDLVDVASKTVLSSWNITKKAELNLNELYSIIISAVIVDIRSKLDSRISNVRVPQFEATICIDNIKSYQSYQNCFEALASTQGITEIQKSSIFGHSICHKAKIKGTLDEIMRNFKDKNISADIQIKDDSAHIVIE
jgi:hypothetical protein